MIIFLILGTPNNYSIILDFSNPSNPIDVGRINNIYGAWGTEIKGNFLYSSTSDFGLQVFDISDPLNTTETGKLDLPTTIDLKIKENTAFLTHPRNLYAVDISNPFAPQFLNQLDGAGGFGIQIENNYAYTITFGRVVVTDISDINNLREVGYYPIPE